MEIINKFIDILSKPLFSFNNNSITIAKILILILSFVLLFYASNKFKNLLAKKLLKGRNFSEASKQTIAILSRYFILVLGLIIILNQIGIDLNSLAVIFGALGVGIGFGLQNVINNFVSCIIIVFERPVQVGDRIEVADVEGNVLEINLRSTTVRTNDNVNIIVPNSEFISKNVVNWSHSDKKVRRRISVGVSYQEDPEKIK
ncbi:MAG: mechanosensitive ion channel, partial [Bdellovibrionales bacterium]|nr:mechanosensitive ion channel [Bdellovibrionales bacterium]